MATTEAEAQSLPALTDIDRLIHEPARLMILALLYVVESADFIFLMRQTELTWGNLSSYMSKLEEAGYIQGQVRSRMTASFTAEQARNCIPLRWQVNHSPGHSSFE